MADARRMGKSELFSHFAERFEVKRTQAREFFDELTTLAEKELKRSGEFVLPGMVKLVVQKAWNWFTAVSDPPNAKDGVNASYPVPLARPKWTGSSSQLKLSKLGSIFPPRACHSAGCGSIRAS